eukprot:3630313-Prymnesium_polylepis.1
MIQTLCGGTRAAIASRRAVEPAGSALAATSFAARISAGAPAAVSPLEVGGGFVAARRAELRELLDQLDGVWL